MGRVGSDMEVQFLPGVGPKRAELLRKELEVSTVGELLRVFPFRYIDRSSFVRIADARPDMAFVQMRARVQRVDIHDGKRMSVWISDGSGEMEMVFFKGIKWMYEKLQPGAEFIFFGKPTAFNGRINMVHPEVDAPQAASSNSGSGEASKAAGGTMTGVYTSTEKLKTGGITGKVMNKLMEAALNKGLPFVEESMPEDLMRQYGLVPLHFALRNIHFPKDMISQEKAKSRLTFEELFYLQLSLLTQKYVRSRSEQGIAMPRVGEAFNRCYEALPFPLTGAQKRVITEIRGDMKSGHQMNRLLRGEVGSGKTMVAVLTALIAIGNGYQACIMAPTEILAEQHFVTFKKFLGDMNVRVELLTGTVKGKRRQTILEDLENGLIHILVGTHAVLEDTVNFKSLGMVVIDEQHRFGVEQRAKLANKSTYAPDVLIMTATPIPRTLALTVYGDLDVSLMKGRPPGRKLSLIHI